MRPRGNLTGFIPTYISLGAYLVVLGMIFDALDGRLARLTRRTSEFGAQLDSMADVVTFGAVPTALYLTLLLQLSDSAGGDAIVQKIEWRLGLLCALVYASCAAIRLARYNAENVKTESAVKKFNGLPTPSAAAAVVALLILHEDLVHSARGTFLEQWVWAVRWSMGPVLFALGLLMVSRLNYVHVINAYFRRERPPTHLVGLVVLIGIGWYSFHVLLVLLAFTYVISGIVLSIKHRRSGERAAENQNGAHAVIEEPETREAYE
jgi:CDP-diacylglycerol--serine O-phosphatidyltransferase